ncbi:MAG: PilZ domain-containing protein [Candidatus Omnitrophica bacterium]|nr:PilZ domain-containing protein [Candidatus Omnitrophota bacterium]
MTVAEQTERRKYVRIENHDVLKCKRFTANDFGSSQDEEMVRAVLKDLGAGGVLFESDKKIDVGTVLKMEIDVSGWERFKSEFYKSDRMTRKEPLVVLANVVRVEVVEPGRKYDIGVCFSAIDDGHQWALMKYVKRVAH